MDTRKSSQQHNGLELCLRTTTRSFESQLTAQKDIVRRLKSEKGTLGMSSQAYPFATYNQRGHCKSFDLRRSECGAADHSGVSTTMFPCCVVISRCWQSLADGDMFLAGILFSASRTLTLNDGPSPSSLRASARKLARLPASQVKRAFQH